MGNCGSVHRDSKDGHLHSSESHLKISLNQLAPTPRHRQKFSYIGDHFKTVDEVTDALRKAGLESSNLIVGIDFTKSNEWTGKYSFNRRSLHEIGHIPNPYEQAISIIGQTLSPFDEDNLIPCFGFGDASTHDCSIFSFYPDHRPCHGFEEALTRYRDIVPHLRLADEQWRDSSEGNLLGADAAVVIQLVCNEYMENRLGSTMCMEAQWDVQVMLKLLWKECNVYIEID